MNRDFASLIEALIEKSDLMLQALRVDDVDIFTSALDEREILMLELQAHEPNLRILRAQFKERVDFLMMIENQIGPEIQNCQTRLKKNISDVQLERAKLKHNGAKASKYFAPNSAFSGSYFDKKK